MQNTFLALTKKHQICVGFKCLKAKSSVKTAIQNDIGGFIDGCSHMSISNHYTSVTFNCWLFFSALNINAQKMSW